jgi:hypothetical protein
LLTVSIKVNVPPLSNRTRKTKGHEHEEKAGPHYFLGVVAWWRLVLRWVQRLNAAFGQQKQTVTNARLTGGRFRLNTPERRLALR